MIAVAALGACGGGGGGATLPGVASSSASWLAVMRSVPTEIRMSLQAAQTAYFYVDAGATNGSYPSPSAFAAEIQGANPGLLSGSCAAIARMSASVMSFTDASGMQAPSYVVFFVPTAVGTCSQSINVGAAGMNQFSVTVTP